MISLIPLALAVLFLFAASWIMDKRFTALHDEILASRHLITDLRQKVLVPMVDKVANLKDVVNGVCIAYDESQEALSEMSTQLKQVLENQESEPTPHTDLIEMIGRLENCFRELQAQIWNAQTQHTFPVQKIEPEPSIEAEKPKKRPTGGVKFGKGLQT